jgi:hypothetical protein
MYAKKPGIIGRLHGDRKDTNPPMNATIIDISTILLT